MRLPSLCPVDSPLWQRVVDDLCKTRAATQRIPPPLPSAPAARQVAGQSHQHRGPGARWLTEHAITAHSATPSMARPCTSHGAWPPAKRNPLWRTTGGRPSRRSTAAALQGRVRLAICTNRHQCMGGHRQSPRYMVAKCPSGGFKGGRERCRVQATRKRAARKERATSARVSTSHSCHSRIGLHSHTRSCPNPQR